MTTPAEQTGAESVLTDEQREALWDAAVAPLLQGVHRPPAPLFAVVERIVAEATAQANAAAARWQARCLDAQRERDTLRTEKANRALRGFPEVAGEFNVYALQNAEGTILTGIPYAEARTEAERIAAHTGTAPTVVRRKVTRFADHTTDWEPIPATATPEGSLR